MRDHIWQALRTAPRFAHLGRAARRAWIGDRELVTVAPGQPFTAPEDAAYLFVASGELAVGDDTVAAPALVAMAGRERAMVARGETRGPGAAGSGTCVISRHQSFRVAPGGRPGARAQG